MKTLYAIVYYSGLGDLQDCLSALPRASSDLDICVLDASPDAEAREVAEASGVRWLDGSRNGGYAWGLHEIVNHSATAPEILVCSNPDVIVPRESLSDIIATVARTGGVCYPVQLDESGAVAHHNLHPRISVASALAKWLWFRRQRRMAALFEVALTCYQHRSVTPLPPRTCGSGAMLAMPLSVWERTGGLNTKFFLFSEDGSFGAALEDLGVPRYLCGNAPVIHPGGFRGRGAQLGSTVESMVSEQIYWSESARVPMAVLISLQVVGLAVRAVYGTLGQGAARNIYWHALKFRLRHLGIDSAAARAPDGYRIPVLSGREE